MRHAAAFDGRRPRTPSATATGHEGLPSAPEPDRYAPIHAGCRAQRRQLRPRRRRPRPLTGRPRCCAGCRLTRTVGRPAEHRPGTTRSGAGAPTEPCPAAVVEQCRGRPRVQEIVIRGETVQTEGIHFPGLRLIRAGPAGGATMQSASGRSNGASTATHGAANRWARLPTPTNSPTGPAGVECGRPVRASVWSPHEHDTEAARLATDPEDRDVRCRSHLPVEVSLENPPSPAARRQVLRGKVERDAPLHSAREPDSQAGAWRRCRFQQHLVRTPRDVPVCCGVQEAHRAELRGAVLRQRVPDLRGRSPG